MRMEVSKHGSPVFIRVIRGLFYSLFWIARRVVPMNTKACIRMGRWLKAAAYVRWECNGKEPRIARITRIRVGLVWDRCGIGGGEK